MRLNDLATKYGTDKKMPDGMKAKNGLHGHGYTQYYERILKDFPVKNMIEIGISNGCSLKMWAEYFNYESNIVAIDIEHPAIDVVASTTIMIGDQSDIEFLKTIPECEYDFIIDDGSHKPIHQKITFNYLFNKLKSGGIYVIEDVHKHHFPIADIWHNDIRQIEVYNSLRTTEQQIYIIHKR